MSRVRNYVFTLNNYTLAQIGGLTAAVDVDDHDALCVYLIMQEEIGSETGTPHLQGYMELHKASSMRTVKRKLGIGFNSLHLEARRGTQGEAVAYCKKTDTFKPGGIRWEMGRKKRLSGNSAINLVLEGATMLRVAEEEPVQFVRHFRGLLALKLITAKPRDWPMEVIIYVGATGTGKS